jgi:hypothetical protein
MDVTALHSLLIDALVLVWIFMMPLMSIRLPWEATNGGSLCLGERGGEFREKVGSGKAFPFEDTMWMSTDLG